MAIIIWVPISCKQEFDRMEFASGLPLAPWSGDPRPMVPIEEQIENSADGAVRGATAGLLSLAKRRDP